MKRILSMVVLLIGVLSFMQVAAAEMETSEMEMNVNEECDYNRLLARGRKRRNLDDSLPGTPISFNTFEND